MNGISKTYCGHYLPDSKVSGNIGAKILGILGKEMAEFPNTFESGKYHTITYQESPQAGQRVSQISCKNSLNIYSEN